MPMDQKLPKFLLLLHLLHLTHQSQSQEVCIIGSGISGASLAHFIKHYSCTTENPSSCIDDIRIFERSAIVGGRMATVTIRGDTFEAGASIIHPKNLHALRFTSMLNLTHRAKSEKDSDSWFGIWDGSRFVFKTLKPPASSSSFVYRQCWIDSCLTTKNSSLILCLRRWMRCSNGLDCMNSPTELWARN